MSSRTWAIARREFMATVTRKGYLFTLVLMPAWIAFAFSFGSLPERMSGSRNENPLRWVGVVDSSGSLRLAPGEIDTLTRAAAVSAGAENAAQNRRRRIYIARPYRSLEAAKQGFASQEISGFLVLSQDYLTSGRLTEYRRSSGLFSRIQAAPWRAWIRRRLAEGRLEPTLLARVEEPGDPLTYTPDDHGSFKVYKAEDEVGSFLVPFGFAMLLFTTMFTSAGYLLQGLGEEKESRILESLLSSVTADELMRGKLIGLGGAGLLMGIAWGTIGLNVLLFAAPSFVPSPLTLVLLGVYFILGYVLFGALALGLGSLVNSYQEATTISAILSFTAVIPMMLGLSFMGDQGTTSPLARALSLFPMTAPITMSMRLSQGNVPTWEIALSLVLLAVAGWYVLRLASRVFRVALLLYGKTWNLPEILRWARQA